MLSSSAAVAYAEPMAYFILRVLIAALGLWLATEWVPGIAVATPTTLILAALILGVVNAIVRPIVVLLTLPVTLLIDKEGRIADIHAGIVDKAAWERRIQSLLRESTGRAQR